MFEEIYRESRQLTVGLAMGLSVEDLARTVPACPEWTVHQLIAHLAGVAADTTAGRLDAPPDPSGRHGTSPSARTCRCSTCWSSGTPTATS